MMKFMDILIMGEDQFLWIIGILNNDNIHDMIILNNIMALERNSLHQPQQQYMNLSNSE